VKKHLVLFNVTVYQANRRTNSAMSQHNTVCVVRLAPCMCSTFSLAYVDHVYTNRFQTSNCISTGERSMGYTAP